MARREIVVWTDDLDGTEDKTVKTQTFALNGVEYEIDLTEGNARELVHALAKFIGEARVVKGKRHVVEAGTLASLNGHGSSNGHKPTKVDALQRKAIREWAVASGYQVKPQGRISEDIMEAFHRSGGRVSPPPSLIPESEEVETQAAKAVARAVAAKTVKDKAIKGTVLEFKPPRQRAGEPAAKKAARKAAKKATVSRK